MSCARSQYAFRPPRVQCHRWQREFVFETLPDICGFWSLQDASGGRGLHGETQQLTKQLDSLDNYNLLYQTIVAQVRQQSASASRSS